MGLQAQWILNNYVTDFICSIQYKSHIQKIGKVHWKGSIVNYYFSLLHDVHFSIMVVL